MIRMICIDFQFVNHIFEYVIQAHTAMDSSPPS